MSAARKDSDDFEAAAAGFSEMSGPFRGVDNVPKWNVQSIQVTDPRQQGEGISAFTSYTVCTVTTSDEKHNVSRRFRDFLWVHTRLRTEYPGCVIPPLPDKNYLTRFDKKNIQARRRGMEQFLNRVAKHQILSQAPEFCEFCTLSEEKFNQLRESGTVSHVDEKSSTSPGYRNWIVGIVANQIETITAPFTKGSVNYEKSQTDITFEELSSSNKELVRLLNSVVRRTGDLRKAGKDISSAWFELGMSLTLVGQYETNKYSKMAGEILHKFGDGADRMSVMINHNIELEEADFEDLIDDLARIAQAVQDMLESRQQYLSKYIQALQNLENSKAYLATAKEKNKAEKFAAAEQQVKNAEDQVTERKLQLEKISSSALTEMQEFAKEKEHALKKLIIDQLKYQINLAQKVFNFTLSSIPF